MKTKKHPIQSKIYLLIFLMVLVVTACNTESSSEIIKEEDGNNETLDTDAKGDCKTIKMVINNGEIRNSYTIEYNAEGKISQAVGTLGKYTFSYTSDSYFYSNYNAAGNLTITKQVQLNSQGKPVSYIEDQYSDNGNVYRTQEGTFTYTNGKLSEIKITEDGYQIRLYKLFRKNGNVTHVEDNGIVERKYEYYTEYKYPTDGLICVETMEFLQTGTSFLSDNENLMKHSEVDTIISDFTYQYNDHGKIVSQKIVRNDLSEPVYFTPTYTCN